MEFSVNTVPTHAEYVEYLKELARESREGYDAFIRKLNPTAWLISTCYVKFPEKTEAFLQDNSLSAWTHNKAIRKICEYFRVSDEDKARLKGLIRREAR
jgi:hypothetical protein